MCRCGGSALTITSRAGATSLRGKLLYCCLGVLCDAMQISEWNGNAVKYRTSRGSISTSAFTLPQFLLDEVGIADRQQTDLIDMNDDPLGRFNFNKIAYWIEKHL